jgi:hypothetical protein
MLMDVEFLEGLVIIELQLLQYISSVSLSKISIMEE